MIGAVSILILSLFPFWFIRNLKYVLFWIYLWQLKQYHRGRFFEHFRTEKGKKALWNPPQILKIILLIFLLLKTLTSPEAYLLFFPPVLFFLYFLETLLYFKSLFAKRIKKPDFTKKTIFLFVVNIFAVISFFILLLIFVKNVFWSAFSLLLFDVLLPLIVSIIVIIFQPLADYYRLSLQKKAKEKIKKIKSFNNNLTIIAITGSYGKTSTKEYLTTILSSRFKVLATKEHQNTEVAIPQIILNNLRPDHEIFIAELGAYDKGTIKRICDFLHPEIGIVTGINEQHLALFGSMENLISAEGGVELAKSLPENGVIILNENSEKIQTTKSRIKNDNLKLKIISCSTKIKNDYWAENIKIEKERLFFSVFSKDGEKADFRVNVFGGHNVENILMAVAVANNLGMTLKEIAKEAEKITEQQSSLKITKNRNGLTIIDSTYSANPDGVIADLEYLKIYSGKKIIIMPCLIELGSASLEVHRRIGRKIAEICDLGVVTAGECFEAIKEGAIKNGMKEENIQLIANADLIIKKLNLLCDKNNIILLEGRLSREIIDKIKNLHLKNDTDIKF